MMLIDASVPGIGEVATRAVVVAHADGAEAGGGVDAGRSRGVAKGVGERLCKRGGGAVSCAGREAVTGEWMPACTEEGCLVST